jgi:hypothetical protein
MLSLQGVVSLSLLFHGSVRMAYIEVTQEHIQNLISQGYMIAAELATYHVPEYPVSPALTGATFFECGFRVPWHRFLHFLL